MIGVLAAGLIILSITCKPSVTLIKLPSGRFVELIAIGQDHQLSEIGKTLRVNYFGHSRSAEEAVQEGDDIVASFSAGAIRDGYSVIIVQQTFPVLGRRSCITRGNELRYTAAADGTWSRTRDQ